MSIVALITAGGSGSRMHQNIPKQFLTVNERPVIVYTLEVFERHPEIDAIAVVCIDGWENVLDRLRSTVQHLEAQAYYSRRRN